MGEERWSLVDVLAGERGVAGEIDGDLAFRVLRPGLHQASLVMAVMVFLRAVEEGRVPAGTTGRFAALCDSPTEGDSLSFATWLARHLAGEPGGRLVDYLAKDEKGKRAWLGEMLRLRKELVHPQTMTREQVLERAAVLLREVPGPLAEPCLEMDDAGEIAWIEDATRIHLSPFVRGGPGGPRPFGRFRPPRELLGDRGTPLDGAAAEATWRRARRLDPLLDDPEPGEVLERALSRRRIPGVSPAPARVVRKLLSPDGPPAAIVTPGVVAPLLAALAREEPDRPWVDVPLEAGETAAEGLARVLGLARAPDGEELRRLLAAPVAGGIPSPWVLAFRTAALGRREFLDCVGWAFDLAEWPASGRPVVLLERGEDVLGDETDWAWERLPAEDLGRFLRLPRRSPVDLPGCAWTPGDLRPWWRPW